MIIGVEGNSLILFLISGFKTFVKISFSVFKKIITMPIDNEVNSVSARELYKVATENKFNVEKSDNFAQALKKISSKEKKLIVCFGSLYNCGNILNKN